MLDDGPYVATSIAIEESTIIRLKKEFFLQMMRENPVIHFKFTRLMTERLRMKFIFLKELANPDPERKITTVLNYYKLENEVNCHGRHRIDLTRQQIASMTGLRVETVIRTIRSLHDAGKLYIERGKVFC
jgi:CRP-like cAMP-binding protein